MIEQNKPAWAALEGTGIQAEEYQDSAREDLHQLFIKPPKKVLDIGCAAGRVAQTIKDKYQSELVWGCELDSKAAEIAKTRLDYVSTKPIEQWTVEEIARLKTIDTVLLLDVLEHMYNPWQTLNVLQQHLPNDAQIIISLPNVGNCNIIHDLINGYWHYKQIGILDVTHIRFFTEYEMFAMFYQTGYRVVLTGYINSKPIDASIKFPYELDIANGKIIVRDPKHWSQLHATQIAFHITKASDQMLSQEELQYRYGVHPQTRTF